MTPVIEELVERLDANEDARALVREILDFHRDGITRIVAALVALDTHALEQVARDPLVRSVLGLHGLAPPEPERSAAPSELLPIANLLAKRDAKRKARAHDDVACDLCGVGTGPRHAHLVDLEHNALRCACLACALLLDRPGAKLKRVPDAVRRVASLEGADAAWQKVGVPVAIAFFVKRTPTDEVRAFYPGAVGVVESSIDAAAFAALEAAHPAIVALEPDVEAFVVSRANGEREFWIVGVDRAYALAGQVREKWSGFTGGDAVRGEIAGFFAGLAREAS